MVIYDGYTINGINCCILIMDSPEWQRRPIWASVRAIIKYATNSLKWECTNLSRLWYSNNSQ